MTTTTLTNGTVNTTASGQSYITGIASGLDTNSLITAAVAKKTKQADELDSQVSTNTNKISAYQTLETLVSNVQSSLSALKSAKNTTGGSSANNVFNTKQVSYASSDGSSAGNILTATADATAAIGSHSVVVTQLAQALSITSATVTSPTAALGYSGSFSLNIDGDTAAPITITAGQSLTDLKNAINATTGTSGVSADILQVSGGSYELVLKANDTDKQINITGVSGDDVLHNLGVTANDGSFSHVTQAAQGAVIKLDNETVTSTSNSFNDVLTGLDINVANTAPGTTVTVKVGNNIAGVQNALNSFITAYNALSDYSNANQQVAADGSVSSNQVLHGDSILNGVTSAISNLVTSGGNGASSLISSLGGLGITLNNKNDLTISNQTQFTTALNGNFSDVQSLFQTSLSSSADSALRVSLNSSSVNTDFNLNVTVDGNGQLSGVTADGDSAAFTINGNQLVGNAGTKYDGLVLTYTGTTSQSISVSLKQGLADAATNLLDTFGNSSSGIINKQIASLNATDTQLSSQSATVRANAATYQQSLINKYAAAEAKISSANLLKQELEALLNADTKNN